MFNRDAKISQFVRGELWNYCIFFCVVRLDTMLFAHFFFLFAKQKIYYQNRPLSVLVTCATVCSPIGMSSLRKSTRFTTADGSASRMILCVREIENQL